MWTMPNLLPPNNIPVSVVPIPSMAGLASTASRICWLAASTACRSASTGATAGHVVVQMRQGGDDDVAGDVTGGHAAHAVRDGEQPGPRVDGVLVSLRISPRSLRAA
jgi:hypothetical protein